MSDVVISVENLGKKYKIHHQAERQRYTALRDVIAQKFAAAFKFLRSSPPRSGESDATLAHRMGEGLGVRASGEVSKNSQLSLRAVVAEPEATLNSQPSSEDFWALREVSFSVRRGEVVGIIGLPREIDFHQPTHWTSKCTQFVWRADYAGLPFHRGTNGAGKSTLRWRNQKSEVRVPTSDLRLPASAFRPRISLLEVRTGFHPKLTGCENIFLNGPIVGMIGAETTQTKGRKTKKRNLAPRDKLT